MDANLFQFVQSDAMENGEQMKPNAKRRFRYFLCAFLVYSTNYVGREKWIRFFGFDDAKFHK